MGNLELAQRGFEIANDRVEFRVRDVHVCLFAFVNFVSFCPNPPVFAASG